MQIETPAALANAEEIAAVPGVDILFLGPGDMSLRLGCSPAVNDPVMMDVQKQIAAACRKHGKTWGRPVGSAADAKTIIDLGAQFVVHGGEFGALHAHFSACSADFDSVLGNTPYAAEDFDSVLNEVSGQPAVPEGKTY